MFNELIKPPMQKCNTVDNFAMKIIYIYLGYGHIGFSTVRRSR